ncbi:L-type lectin-domain receptor kinase IV.2-like protein, partial [Trifolium medium]|nr:L-type lectin-domain receptor kinase IV.2-like protein [Trifolium medium]
DFGLSRLYDHGTDPQTTHVVGTLGYLAPEHTRTGEIIEAKDVNLGVDYVVEEVELVLKLGLLCSHCEALARPSMRQVLRYLERDLALPDLSFLSLSSMGLTSGQCENFQDFGMSYASSSMDRPFSHTSSIAESLLSGGR